MKRVISIILTVVMIMATMCLPAAATETAGEKVFSLDFSDYATGGAVKNGVTNSDDGIKTIIFTGNTASTGPVVGQEYTVNGDVIDYIEFTEETVSSLTNRTEFRNEQSLGAVRLSPELMQTLLNGSDAMTIEFWMQPYANYKSNTTKTYYCTASGSLYNYGVGTDAAANASQFEIYDGNNTAVNGTVASYNNTYNVMPMGKAMLLDSTGATVKALDAKYSLSARYKMHTDNPWVHYVITREWKYDENSTTTGDYYWSVYEDGVSRTSNLSNTTTFGENVVKNDESAYPFVIGGSDDGTEAGSAAQGTFDGAIAEFNIYNYAMDSAEATALYAIDDYAKYKAERLAEGISLTAPTAGEEITPAPGEIELTFDNVVDQASLSKIKMVDANGNDIKGGILVSTPDAFSKTVTVKYGTPTAGATYKVVVPADFSSVNGYTLGTAKELIYTVADSRVIVNHDFSALPEKAASGTGFKYLNGTVGTDYVATTYNGVNALKITDATKATKHFGYALPVDDKRDMKFTLSVAIDGTNNANQRFIRLGYDYNLMNIATTNSLDNYKDENGFATFTAEFSYDGTGTNYSAYLFDSNGTQKGKQEGISLNSGNKGIFVQHHHNPAFSKDSTYISQYKVEVINRPEVFYHNADGIKTSAETIDLVFTDDITTTGVTATLTDTTDNTTVTLGTPVYTDSARKLSLPITGGLTAGHNYSLTLSGVKSTEGAAMKEGYALAFTAAAAEVVEEGLTVEAPIVFTDEEGTTIVTLSNQQEINAAFRLTNNTDESVTPCIFVVLYGENGKMIGHTLKNDVTITVENYYDYNVGLDVPAIEDLDLTKCTVKCIGLKNMTSLEPIFADKDGYCL